MHHGDTAATNSHDHKSLVNQAADCVCFHNGLWNRGGDDTAPTASGIFHHGPAFFCHFFFGSFFVHEGTNGFGWVLEGGIVAIDDGLGDHRRGLFVDPAQAKFIVQGLLEHVANGTLGVGAAIIQRDFMQLVGRDFGTAQDETNLWTIAMRDHDIPAINDHTGDVFHRFRGSLILIWNGLMVFIFD